MRISNILIILIIFLCCSLFAAAASNYTYYENFYGSSGYNTSFWTFKHDGTGEAYWHNGTNPGLFMTATGSTFPYLTSRNIPAIGNYTHPTSIEFNVNWGTNHTVGANEHFGVGVMTAGLAVGAWSFLSTPPVTCGLWLQANGNDGHLHMYAQEPALTSQDLGALDAGLHLIKIEVTQSGVNSVYSYYVDGHFYGQVVQGSSAPCENPTLAAYVFGYKSAGSDWIGWNTFDYRETSYDSNTTPSNHTYYDIGFPCSLDSDCISNRCVVGVCQCVFGGEIPYDSSQCCTHEVVNGKCTTPSAVQTWTLAKNQFLGSDQTSSDMLCVLLVLIPAILLAYWGFASGSFMIGGGLATFWAVMGTVLFVMLGWMSPIFLFGLFLIIFFGATVLVILGRG